jgi:hypothetical protein
MSVKNPETRVTMLYEFVTTYRQDSIEKAKHQIATRPRPFASVHELQCAVPLCLTSLAAALQSAVTDIHSDSVAIDSGASLRALRTLKARVPT